MSFLIKQLSYFWTLLISNIKSYGPETKRLFIMSFFMMVQNSMFFVLWIILFNTVSDIKGWQLADVSRMFGITASAVGLSMFLFNGVRGIPYRVLDGTMDFYLTKPRHPLPILLLSSSNPASLGDLLYGPLLWIFLGNVSGIEWLILPVVTLFAAIVFLATMIAFYSLSFWLKNNTRFSEQLFEMLIIASSNILRGQPLGVKIIVFTIIPAGFINLIPTMLVREFDIQLFMILFVSAGFYLWIATKIFNAGIAQYKSS